MAEHAASKLERFWSASYFPALDGLRALCLVMVIFNHSHVHIPKYVPTFVGVDIFFVLSGFLITTLLLRERETYGNVTLKGFYTRRAFRILPVYFAVLLMYFAAIFAVHDGRRWHELMRALPYLVTFTQEFRPASSDVYGHTWSLGYEEKFYLIWPLLLLALYPLRDRRLWGTVSLGALLVLLPGRAGRSYGGLLLGSVLALVLDRQRPNVVQRWLTAVPTTALLLLAMLGYAVVFVRPGAVLLFSACVTLLTGSLVLRASWWRSCLEQPVVVLFGKRSYAMYLIHVLCLNAVERVATKLTLMQWYVTVPATFLVSFVGATLLFYVVERPCIDRGRRLSKAMRQRLQRIGRPVAEMPVIEREEPGTARAF